MALTVTNIKPTVSVNDHAPVNGDGLIGSDLISTSGSGSVDILSNGTRAATVSGPKSTITTYSPPTYSLDRIFYNNSWRYRLNTPGGYVGIRG